MKTIFTVEPWRKSSGVKKNPQISPVVVTTTAATATIGNSQSVVRMNFSGLAYSQSDDMRITYLCVGGLSKRNWRGSPKVYPDHMRRGKGQ